MLGGGASLLFIFVICLEIGNLSRDKLEVVIGVFTENGNRNHISASHDDTSTVSLFKALHQLYLINLHDSTAIQGNGDH